MLFVKEGMENKMFANKNTKSKLFSPHPLHSFEPIRQFFLMVATEISHEKLAFLHF